MYEHTHDKCLVSCKHIPILILVAVVLGVVVGMVLVACKGKCNQWSRSRRAGGERSGSGREREGARPTTAEKLTREVGEGEPCNSARVAKNLPLTSVRNQYQRGTLWALWHL